MVGMKGTETENHILLKALGFVLCYRDRMEIEQRLHRSDIIYVPDLVRFDFTLDVDFWGECGDCAVDKLNRLAVKAPLAEIWVFKKCHSEADDLIRAMEKAGLRKNRYHIASVDGENFREILAQLNMKNSLYLCSMDWESGEAQFDFNGLWFDITIRHQSY